MFRWLRWVLSRRKAIKEVREDRETAPLQLGLYSITFFSLREPIDFDAECDEQALRKMCDKLGMRYPPMPGIFKSRGGSALYRIQPLEQIFPRERIPEARAGVARSFSEQLRPAQVPNPMPSA